MAIPANIELTTLFVEKCTHSGISRLQKLSRRSEAHAVEYLGELQTRYRGFYAHLSKEEIVNNLFGLMYGLSAEGDMLLAVALYKELMHSSLQEAVEKQRKIISMFNAYNEYLRRRKDRGDRIGRG